MSPVLDRFRRFDAVFGDENDLFSPLLDDNDHCAKCRLSHNTVGSRLRKDHKDVRHRRSYGVRPDRLQQ